MARGLTAESSVMRSLPLEQGSVKAHESVHPLSVVSVTYNSSTILPTMLGSLPSSVHVVVVDNGSADFARTKDIVGAHGGMLIGNQENVGFGRACNQGAKLVDTDLILFLNPDTSVTNGALDNLVRATESYPNASAFNPAIEDANGRPIFRRSSVIDPSSWRLPKGWPRSDQEVSVLSGAALLVRRHQFDALSGFDPKIFLYHEDDDLCLRLRKRFGPLMFIRSALVVHQGGSSSGRDAATAHLKGFHMGQSRVYASLKHGKALAFERALIGAFGELLLLPRLFSARRRSKSVGYLSGILRARSTVPSTAKRLGSWLQKLSNN